jgi:hypothetical protein
MARSLYVKEVKRHQSYCRYLLYWIFYFYALQNYLVQRTAHPHTRAAVPDPHYFRKLDPEPGPHLSEKQD